MRTFTMVVLLMAMVPFAAAQEADMILTGGTIYTVDDQQPTAEAVAVFDGKVLAVVRLPRSTATVAQTLW